MKFFVILSHGVSIIPNFSTILANMGKMEVKFSFFMLVTHNLVEN